MDSSNKRKKQKRRKVTGAIVALLIVGALAALPFILEDAQQEDSGASILSGRVETGSIEKTVSGAGTLTAQEGVKVDLPDGVKVTRYLVSNGDTVTEGQQLAAVDKNSVLLAMSNVQDVLDEIEEDMVDCDGETLDTVIYSNVKGTVIAIYAEKGDEVADVMAEHGALALITLADGKQINITGIDGTVTSVNLREGGSVFVGAKCFYLENTSSTGLYSVLLDEHRDYEKLMTRLSGMYVTGAIDTPCDGAVSGIDDAAAKELEKNIKVIHASAAAEEYPKEETSSIAGTVKSYADGILEINTGTMPYPKEEVGAGWQINENDFIVFTKTATQASLGANWEISYSLQSNYGDINQYSNQITPPGDKNNNNSTNPTIPTNTGFGSGGISMGGFSMAAGSASAADSRYPLSGSTLMTVTPQEKVSVSITVDEMDILSVNVGDEAVVTVDALPGRSFPGIVTERNTAASNSGGNSKYSAVVTLDRQENMLDGMNASILITFSRSDGLKLIPAEAVAEENGETVVYTGYDETSKKLIKPVRVTTGLSDGEKVEITSGLELNDEFYYEYFDTLEIDGILNGGGSVGGLGSLLGGGSRPGGGMPGGFSGGMPGGGRP